mgnify:CR=1 FL=1
MIEINERLDILLRNRGNHDVTRLVETLEDLEADYKEQKGLLEAARSARDSLRLSFSDLQETTRAISRALANAR